MKLKTFLALPLFAILSSCAVTSQIMENDLGQQMECSAFGWGAIGTTVALVKQSNCEEKLRASGYVNIEDRDQSLVKTNTIKPLHQSSEAIGALLTIKDLQHQGFDFPDWVEHLKVYYLTNKTTENLPNGQLLVRAALVYKNARLIKDDINGTGKSYYISYIINTSEVDIEKSTTQTKTLKYYDTNHILRMTGDHSSDPVQKFDIKTQMGRGLSLLGKYN